MTSVQVTPPDPSDSTTWTNPATGISYIWNPRIKAWDVAEFPPVIIDSDPPSTGNNNKPLIQGDLWFDSDQLALYVATKDSSDKIVWVICIPGATGAPGTQDASVPVIWPVAVDGEEWVNPLTQVTYVFNAPKKQWINVNGGYVKSKGGDTMEGQLTINGPRNAGDNADKPDIVSSVKVLSIDNAQNSSLQLRHGGNAKVDVGDNDVAIASDIKFNRAAGSVVKSNVQDLLNIGNNEIAYLGQSIEDEDLITKKYVDDTKEFLQNEIIELEEEIDAIAPSVERGKWRFTAVGTVAQPGQFTMYDAEFGNGNPTGLFKSAKSIWFNELDTDGIPHAFADVDDGELLEIFVDGSPEYGLYEVVGEAHDETPTGTKFWVIDVNFIRTNEATTTVDGGDLCRFKIFMAPTGGDASSFVLKSGDKMTGDLVIDVSEKSDDNEAGLTLKGSRPSVTNSAATITFENEQSTEKGYITYRSDDGYAYFGFNQDLFLNHHALFSVNSITMWPNSGIGATSNTPLLTFHNRSTGNQGDGLLKVPRPADDRRSFVIRGNDVDGNEGDMFYTYTSPTGTPDAVNYRGKMDNDYNLVNKAYVDKKVLLPSFEQYPVMLHSGNGRKYSYTNMGSLNEDQFTSDSDQASSGNYLYLSKLWGQKRGWTQVVNYDRTQDSTIEVWEADGDVPVLIMRAGIQTIVQSEHSQDDARIAMNRFWSKPGYSFSKSRNYTFMLHGLVERAELISPLS